MIKGMDPDPQRDSDSITDEQSLSPTREGSPIKPLPPVLSEERVALGHALQARAVEVGRLVDERFSADLKGHAYVAARLATYLIGRWLATDEAASAEDEEVLARQGERALMEDTVLASVAKAYFAWRDLTCMAVIEEANRLAVSEELVTLACDVVRLSCDGSLVRIVRQFDQTRRRLRRHLDEEQATLAHRAMHDQLTGLPNRALLVDRLGQAAEALPRRRNAAMLLYLDLDNFKAVNDRFGHSAGDCLLTEVAVRLQDLIRATDTVARLGGDEFVVLAMDLDDPEYSVRSLAERIHQAMGAPVAVGDRNLYTSVSIGIAPVTAGVDPEVCLAQADAAMYEAKRGGPARYECFTTVMGDAHRRRSQLAHELRTAHELGQLSVHYQPLFKLGGDVVGMEALLRWRHPELGSIPPVDFIPLLERSRDIIPVGRWVLDEAARQCRTWQEQGLAELTMSVNVSARQLQDPDFFEDVRQALDRSRLDPDALVLEITESVLVVDLDRIGAMMRRIRDLGVHMALDDFGTGYSSLLYLRGLPIDRLKVDRSFVAGLGASDQDTTIVSAVVDLAHKLGLRVVAEGVETEAELHAVGAMGCDEAQGFLLGRPGPPQSFASPHVLSAST
jgi:diguanylate cyclase (GGDEF)-like protein